MAFSTLGTDAFADRAKKKKGPNLAVNKAGNIGALSSKATSPTGSAAPNLTDKILGGVGTAIAGPFGGAIATGIGSAIDANRADKAEDPNRPKNRRLAGLAGFIRDKRMNEATAVATLSDAVFRWAASIK